MMPERHLREAREALRSWGPELRALGGWERGPYGVRRINRNECECECPITAIHNARGLGFVESSDARKAAQALGLSPLAADAIIKASDRTKPVPPGMRSFTLEGIVLDACGIPPETEEPRTRFILFDEIATRYDDTLTEVSPE